VISREAKRYPLGRARVLLVASPVFEAVRSRTDTEGEAMMPTAQFNSEPTVPAKVSILARLVPLFSYVIAMLGAALSSLLIVRTFEGMRNAEAAGIAAVAGGLSEASQTAVIALYLAIFVGVIGIVLMIARSLMTTATASPSGWFFLITGGLSLIPQALLWKAESLIVQAISPGNHNVVEVASTIQLCLTATLITSVTFALILLVCSLVPLPAALSAKRNYAPLVVMVLMELALIALAVAFQGHASWLYQVRINQRL